jgi:hypothetical protein
MWKWIKSYLHNRRSRVTVDGYKSRKFLLRHGVPQGGVISPTLFLVFINDIIQELPPGVKAALYADDLVVWCTAEYTAIARKLLQSAADKITAWANNWMVKINAQKSSTTLFTLSNKDKIGKIKLGDTYIKGDNEPTYLGITLDRRSTWKSHIDKAVAKSRRKLNILRKLAGTNWGANANTLNRIYTGVIRPNLEYGSSAWSCAAKSHRQALDRVQNQALRVITGAMRTTPIVQMENITGIPPLGHRRDTKTMVQAEKYKSMPAHPMKTRFGDLAIGRIQRSSFIHRSKRLIRQHKDVLPDKTLPIGPTLTFCPWEDSRHHNVSINTSIGQYAGREVSDVVKRTAVYSMIEELYPKESWIHVYTDGSATRAVKNGGAGVYMDFPDKEKEYISLPTGIFCSNYMAEVHALKLSAEDH